METKRALELFRRYGAGVAYVEVERPNGDRDIGSAFHVGEGVFVTARHVVESNEIVSVGTTETAYIPLTGKEAAQATTFLRIGDTDEPVHRVDNGPLRINRGPFLHAHPQIDIAVFRVADIDPYAPVLPLGDHLDDWLGESDFVLSEAVLLGYPPIPLARRPVLVGARAEVSAMIDRYDAPHVHFILSATPRGGFSGGVAISEWGQVLGLITQSVHKDGQAVELGYLTVIGVEPIYVCLADYKLLPEVQAQGWNGLWNTSALRFSAPGTDVPNVLGGLVTAVVELFDDGKTFSVTVTCDDDEELFGELIRAVEAQIPDAAYRREGIRSGMERIRLSDQLNAVLARTTARKAAQAAVDGLTFAGYLPIMHDSAGGYFTRPEGA